MTGPIADCLAGDISAPVAVSRLLLAGLDGRAIGAAIRAAEAPGEAWRALSAVVAGRAAALDALASEIRANGSDHTALGGTAEIAAFFDRAVHHSPEAGVALYSLGDSKLLEAATAEIVDWLLANGLLPAGADVLDLGCGIGRIAAAVAPHCRSVLGLDVAPGMVAEAQRRHGALPNVRFGVTDGTRMPTGPFGLALAVDSMPYILQAGVADQVMAGLATARAVVILNLSYGRSRAEDAADARRWADAHGFAVTASGTSPFLLWDGVAWVFRAR